MDWRGCRKVVERAFGGYLGFIHSFTLILLMEEATVLQCSQLQGSQCEWFSRLAVTVG